MEVNITVSDGEARRLQGLVKSRIEELERMLTKEFDRKDDASVAARNICETSLRDLKRVRARLDDAYFRSQQPVTR